MSADEKRRGVSISHMEALVRDAWLGTLGAFERTEGELHRLGERLREAFAGDEGGVSDFLARMRQRRSELERYVDDGVRRAASRLAEPLMEELASLRGRVEHLARRFEERGKCPPSEPSDAPTTPQSAESPSPETSQAADRTSSRDETEGVKP